MGPEGAATSAEKTSPLVNWRAAQGSSSISDLEGHCACAVGHKLYIFGGVHTSGDNLMETNDLSVYDMVEDTLLLEQVSGDVPAKRATATIQAVGNRLYLFGGLSQETGWFDDVHVFDSDLHLWRKVECQGPGPSPRDKLASTTIGSKIYLFGGFGPQVEADSEEEANSEEDDSELTNLEGAQDSIQFGWFNDLFIFETENNTWSSPMQMNLGCPSPRAAHSLCAFGDLLLIFGGRDSAGRQNDLFIFHTESRKWVTGLSLACGQAPEPRSFHTATVVEHQMVVIGGKSFDDKLLNDVHSYDILKRKWTRMSLEGFPARASHTATVVGDQLVIAGGTTQQRSGLCLIQTDVLCHSVATSKQEEIKED